jgi:TonB-dependent SusC/RagA subfamily outer membrane receptor
MRSSARFAPVLLLVPLAAACGRITPNPDPYPDPGPSAAGVQGATAPPGTVTARQVRGVRVTHTEELLQGRVAGVTVTRLPSGGMSVRIRGTNSVNSSNEPLYVVDGFVMQADRGGGISWLSPLEVARIEVLKDPAALAMYGTRGANGVILITTRH